MRYFCLIKDDNLCFVAVLGSIGICDFAKALDASPREQAYLLTPKASFGYYCSPCHGTNGKGDGTFSRLT